LQQTDGVDPGGVI